jgi:hypothetical protein
VVDEATAKAIAGMMRVRELDELSGASRSLFPMATMPTTVLHALDCVLVLGRVSIMCSLLRRRRGGGADCSGAFVCL